MPRPTPISRTEGERIFVDLVDPVEVERDMYDEYGDPYDSEEDSNGPTGFIVLCDHDDGSSQWQSHHWEDAGPQNNLCGQLNAISKKGRHVTKMAFGDGEYYVSGEFRNGSGSHSWWQSVCRDNIDVNVRSISFSQHAVVVIKGDHGYWCSNGVPSELFKIIKAIYNRGGTIHNVCLSRRDSEGWWLSHDSGHEWAGLSMNLSNELKKRGSWGAVCHVTEAKDGSWLVIRDRWFVASNGVPAALTSILASFYNDQSERRTSRLAAINAYDVEECRKAEEAEQARKAEEEEQARQAEKRKREEEERVAKRRRLQSDASSASEKYWRLSEELARRHGWASLGYNVRSRVISYERTPRYGKRERINVYYTTRTIGTCISHPSHPQPTQMFRRLVSEKMLEEIFKDPRVHTGKGYQRRSQLANIPTPSSSSSSSHSFRDRSELDGMVSNLVGSHEDVNPTVLDSEFAHLCGLAMLSKSDSAEYQDLDFSAGQILICSFISAKKTSSTDCFDLVKYEHTGTCSGFPIVREVDPILERAGVKVGDVILSVRFTITNPDVDYNWITAFPTKETKVKSLPYRLGVLREGTRHEIIALRDANGDIGYKVTSDDSIRPHVLDSTNAKSPMQAAGLKAGDILIDVSFPVLKSEKWDCLRQCPPSTAVAVAIFRKAS